VRLGKTGMQKVTPPLEKLAAVMARKKGQNVLMKSRQAAHEVQKAASCGKPILRHSGHELADGSKGSPHYQADGVPGHTFWEGLGAIALGLLNPFDLITGELGNDSCPPEGCGPAFTQEESGSSDAASP
jgi:hypothetical protein